MEEIPGKNCRGESEDCIDRGTAAPDICMVNYIIMEQGGNVQVFKSNGQVIDVFTLVSAEAGSKETEALKTYGANLGRAFQIQDDLLDYQGDPAKTGKTVGNYFCEGKMTLPLIHALKAADKTERYFLLDLLKAKKSERSVKLEEAQDIIAKNGGFEYARELAEKLIGTGIAGLDIFKARHNEQIQATLTGLARYVVQRDK